MKGIKGALKIKAPKLSIKPLGIVAAIKVKKPKLINTGRGKR